MIWIQIPKFLLHSLKKMRPVDDFTRPEVFLEEKSWPGLVACSQRPVLLIICEHTLPAHYHKEANTEGTHEIKVSLLKVIHNLHRFIDNDLHHRHSNGDQDAVEGHLLAPHTNPASICHHQQPLLALRGQKPSPDLPNLTVMRLLHGMITGQMQERLLRT